MKKNIKNISIGLSTILFISFLNSNFNFRFNFDIEKYPENINSIEKIYLFASKDNNIGVKDKIYGIRGKDKIKLYPILKKGSKYYGNIPYIKINDKKIKTSQDSSFNNLNIDLVQITPKIPLTPYQNVSLITRKWLGWEKIKIKKKIIKRKDLSPLEASLISDYSSGENNLGSNWFYANLNFKNITLSSINEPVVGKKGISEKLLRVSYLIDKSFLGYFTSYINVPYIFGSASSNGQLPSLKHQTEKYQGGDCADIIIGSIRQLGKKIDYSYVDDLQNRTKIYQNLSYIGNGFFKDNNNKTINLIFGKNISKGNLIFFDYQGDGVYDHVGAIYKDAKTYHFFQSNKKNNILDSNDLIIHSNMTSVQVSKLGDLINHKTIISIGDYSKLN